MAFDLIRTMIHIPDLSDGEFRVLFYLMHSANHETMECFPKVETIAAKCQKSDRAVRRIIAGLVERGLFDVVEQRRRDGTQMASRYIFKAHGEIQIGSEKPVKLRPEPVETDQEHQPDTSDTLMGNRLSFGAHQTDAGDSHLRTRNQEQGINIKLSLRESKKTDEDLFGESLPAIAEPDLVEWVKDRWNAMCATEDGIQKIQVISESQRKRIRARAETVARQTGTTAFDVWETVIANIQKSTFLRGKAKPGKGYTKPMRTRLDFVLREDWFIAIHDGAHNDDERYRDHSYDSRTGRSLSSAEETVREILRTDYQS